MDSLTAVKSFLMAIAAQGSVTVTIPNDSDLTREMGPIDITRQMGPIEFNIRTAPAEDASQQAPAVTSREAPVVATRQETPAAAPAREAPAKATSENAPEKTASQAAPAESFSEPAPAKAASQAAPAETFSDPAPAKATSQKAPAKAAKPVAPARVARQTPPAGNANETTTVQNTGYAGFWYDHSGRSAIQISHCGEGLCGRIVWLKDTAHQKACGTDIIGGGEKVGDVYDNGWIYDVDRDKKFDVEIKLLSDSELRVKGYAGMKFLSKTYVWRRAPSDLKLCA